VILIFNIRINFNMLFGTGCLKLLGYSVGLSVFGWAGGRLCGFLLAWSWIGTVSVGWIFHFFIYGSEEFKTQDLKIYGHWLFLWLVWWGCMWGSSCLAGMDG
jgi:hypothetical protein